MNPPAQAHRYRHVLAPLVTVLVLALCALALALLRAVLVRAVLTTWATAAVLASSASGSLDAARVLVRDGVALLS